MFRKTIIIALLFVSIKLSGQSTESFRYNDSLTYSLYIEKKWDDLIREGQKAIKNGNDYYYMRMRLGIAYYEKHNYAMSAAHFRRALSFNENDQVALEYLFYSYLLSGHIYQSYTLIPDFYPANRERVLKESKLHKNTLSIESFFSETGTNNIITDPDSYFTDPESGSQIVTDYFINNALFATHLIGNKFSYFHSYTNLIKENYLHYYDGTESADLFPQRVVQNQYYGSLNYFTSDGLVISPSFHLISATYPLLSYTSPGMNSSAKTYNVRMNGFFTGLGVSKSIGYADPGIEMGYLSFNSVKRIQGTLSVIFYPTGNSDLHFGGKISVGQKINYDSSDLQFAEEVSAGFSVAHRVWLEFSLLTGDLDYYSDKNGLYIYNSTDVLKNKFSARIIVPFYRAGLSFFAGGGISSYSSEFIPYDGVNSYNINKLNYNSKNLTGGISWNF